jgi:BASS family bile acid:Na+ symporter
MTLLFDIVLPLLVVFIMVLVGMELRREDFLRVREYPVLVPGIVIGQWIALTIVAGLVGRLLGLPHVVAGGVLLLAAAPVATLSNFYAHLARGHLALAVTVTAVSTVLAVVATPLVAAVGFRLFLGEAAAFDLPIVKMAQQTVFGLVLPVAVGMLIHRRAGEWTLRWRARLQSLGVLAIAAVLGFVVVNQFAAIRGQFEILLAASLLFTIAMLAIGWVVARMVARTDEDRRTLPWGFAARNVAIATLIATAAIGQAQMASFVTVLFATQIALLIPLGRWLGRTHVDA